MVIASTSTAAPVVTAWFKGRKATGIRRASSRSSEPAVYDLDSRCCHLQDSFQLRGLQPPCSRSRASQDAPLSCRMAFTTTSMVDLQSLGGTWGQWKGVPPTSSSWQQKAIRPRLHRWLSGIQKNELKGQFLDGSTSPLATWLGSATSKRQHVISRRVLRCQSGDGEGEKGKGSSGNSSSTATEEPESEASSSSTTPSSPPPPSNQVR